MLPVPLVESLNGQLTCWSLFYNFISVLVFSIGTVLCQIKDILDTEVSHNLPVHNGWFNPYIMFGVNLKPFNV